MILSINGILAGRGVIPSTLLTSLVSVYKAESNANDSFGTNNGTAGGGLTYGAGKSGNAFDLNGTNAFLELPSNTMYLTSNIFSISFWAYCRTSDGNTIISNFDNSTGNKGFYIDTNTGNTVTFRLTSFNGVNIGTLTSIGNKSINTWYNVVFTVSGTTAKIYVNGINENTITLSNSISFFNGCKPLIGAFRSTNTGTLSSYKNMVLDEINIWNKELTPTEVTELYGCGIGKFYPFITTPTIDADACAFITAASITDNTQVSAINQLVTDLKSNNLWSKFYAFYPFVGGTATAHKFNLKDPRDLDAAYRLTFVGGGTHTSLGYVGNGTTGYAKTGIIPNNVFTQNNIHLSYYSQTDAARGIDDIGVFQTSKAPIEVYMRYNTTTSLAYVNASVGSFTVSTGRRYLVASRQSSSAVSVTNNGTTSSISSNSNGNLATIEVYIHSQNFNGSPSGYSNRTSSTVTFGQTLTDAEAQTLSAIVNTFNTTLGRNVY